MFMEFKQQTLDVDQQNIGAEPPKAEDIWHLDTNNF